MIKNLFVVVACALATVAQAAPDAGKLDAAADNISRMKASLKQVLARAEQARNEKDVVKLNCVNEKLTQIKALLKVAEQADVALHESVSAKDQGGEAEFSKIAIARTKVDGLKGESEQCIGQLAYMVDEKTTVEVQQPGNLPGGEQTGGGLSLGVATRGSNPAGSVASLGFGGGSDWGTNGSGAGGVLFGSGGGTFGGGANLGNGGIGGSGGFGGIGGGGFVPPPPVRPPDASVYR